MPRSRSVITNRMIADYCRKRLAPNAPPCEIEMFRRYLADCLEFGREPPRAAKAYDWLAVADELGIESRVVTNLRIELVPIFDAVTRSVRQSGKPSQTGATRKGRSPCPHPPLGSRKRYETLP